MDTDGLYDRLLRDALGCRAVWPPVLTPVGLGDFGVVDGGVFRRLGNVAEFGLDFAVEHGPPSRLDLHSADARLIRLAGDVALPVDGVAAGVRVEFARSDGFVLKCARVELAQIADLGALARRLLGARTPDGRRWRPLAWRLVWQLYAGRDVLFLAARSAGSHVELHGRGAGPSLRGGAGLTAARSVGLGVEVVGDSGPIGLGLARVRLVGGVQFFSGEDDSGDDFVERLPADADAGPEPGPEL